MRRTTGVISRKDIVERVLVDTNVVLDALLDQPVYTPEELVEILDLQAG
jgi:hypothetical protein